MAAGAGVAGLIYAALREPEPVPAPEPPVVAELPAAPPPEAATEAPAEEAPELATELATERADEVSAEPLEETAEAPTEDLADPALVPPAFDVVRIEADGGALVAGQAPAGALVVLRLDDAPLLEAMADAAGQFVVLFALEPSAEPQLLTLEAQLADGRVTRGEDQVILAPRMPAIAALAEPAPEAAPEPVAEAELAPESEAEFSSELPDEPPLVLDEAPAETGAPAPMAEAPAPDAPEETTDLAAAMPEALSEPETEAETDVAPQAEAAPPSFLLRGSGEVAVLTPAPRVMDNVVIDAISYSAEGEVQISGRAGGGADSALMQIYLDNAPIGQTQARNGGWASDLPAVAPGLYTLRVDQLDEAGAVVSRFETPFQREDPERLAQAQVQAQPETPEPAVPEPAATPEPVAEVADEAAAEATAESAIEPAEMAVEPAPESIAETRAETAADTVVEPAPELEAETVAEAPAIEVPEPVAETTPQPVASQPSTPPVQLLTVQPGHSLWAISRDHYGEGVRYVQIFQANRDQIRNPDLIYPGQVFVLPD